jgi:mono/diheme cytochrome c family protein
VRTQLKPALYSLLSILYSLPLSGCRSTPPPTPLNQLNDQQTSGHDIFHARCAQCHYDRISGPLHGPSLRGIFKQSYLPSGAPANDDRVSATILHGRNLMPAQPNLDPTQVPQDLHDLLAYLHTL